MRLRPVSALSRSVVRHCRPPKSGDAVSIAQIAWETRDYPGLALLDPAHDDAAGDRHGVVANREAVSVAIRPRGADRRPGGLLAVADDAVNAVAGFAADVEAGLGH